MKRVLITLTIVLSILTVAWANGPRPATYEYKFVYQCDEKKANSQAAQGWELINLSMTVHGPLGVGTCAFKRSR